MNMGKLVRNVKTGKVEKLLDLLLPGRPITSDEVFELLMKPERDALVESNECWRWGDWEWVNVRPT